jgi:hypothetical protein
MGWIVFSKRIWCSAESEAIPEVQEGDASGLNQCGNGRSSKK